jgi:hypothetical protein
MIARAPGALLAMAGLALHPWVVAPAVLGRSPGAGTLVAALALQLLIVATGVLVAIRPSRVPSAARVVLAVAALGGLAWGARLNARRFEASAVEAVMRAGHLRMLDGEEVIAEMTPRLRDLGRGAQNLDLPGADGRKLFADTVVLADLDASRPPRPLREMPAIAAVERGWEVAPERTVRRDDLSFWRPLLADVAYFEFVKFYFISGEISKLRDDEMASKMGFDALTRTRTGRWTAMRGKMKTLWRRQPGSDPQKFDWRLHELKTDHMETFEVERLPFADVLDTALPDAALRDRARRNRHAELVLEGLIDLTKESVERTFKPPHPHFSVFSQDRHAGVSVVDIDADGFDDLYVTPELGRNMMLRNRGDGTFEDVAPRLGLDLDSHTASTLFADFDNDGDLDAFAGRTLERTAYLSNEGGRFVDRSDRVGPPLPYLVSSLAAADYDGDGLLDVYVSTYAEELVTLENGSRRTAAAQAATMGQERKAATGDALLAEFLSPEDARELARLEREHGEAYVNLYGPPNLLLKNAGGGRFVEATEAKALRLFRNSYQCTWQDYDDDRDPDLYCANDFSPNNLFRNDGGDRFADVTQETQTQDNGFGMGVSWGDYDGDGRQDLYVSNMFSKAGRRITAQIPGIDPRFAEFARGNTLFKNQPGAFARVSGLDPPAVLVEKAGWSWGSQFVDVDNDGWLDLFALNGMYTAPEQVERPVDT